MKQWRDRSVILIAIMAGIVFLAMFRHWFDGERRNFAQQVDVGQTAEEVRASVGAPDDELRPGDELPAWGNADARIVTEPTWVYFVVPGSQHRFVITFRDQQVADVEYAGN